MKKVSLCLLLVFLTSCYFPPPPPLQDGSCPGRVINERDAKISVAIYRNQVEPKNFQVGFEVAAKSSSLVSLPAGKFIVRIIDADNGQYLGDPEILVAIDGSGLFELKPPEIGIEKPEVVYWWVKPLQK